MRSLILLLVIPIFFFANENIQNKHIEKQIEKEKKYKEEQKFYQSKNYDFDSFRVDENSLKNIPKQPDYNEDFDMDEVYD